VAAPATDGGNVVIVSLAEQFLERLLRDDAFGEPMVLLAWRGARVR
jgi:hypothetical protein